jgi:cytochrome c-type biogenesis protein CcmE
MKNIHIALIVIIAVLIGIIVSTLGDASTYVSFDTAEKQMGKKFTVIGSLVKEKEIIYTPKQNLLTFYATDSLSNVRLVKYPGPKPQDFERSEKITMTGYAKKDGFIAEKILMKCPSKYNGQNTVEAKATALIKN